MSRVPALFILALLLVSPVIAEKTDTTFADLLGRQVTLKTPVDWHCNGAGQADHSTPFLPLKERMQKKNSRLGCFQAEGEQV